jgi:tRNA(Ile)-lysidine synthetase-like protein
MMTEWPNPQLLMSSKTIIIEKKGVADSMQTEHQTASVSQGRFVQETLNYIRRRELIQSGEKILVAVSGGLDSTVLLHALSKLSRMLGVGLEVAHVNHQTRGEASEREALWVRVLAERLNIKLHSLQIAIPAKTNQEEMRNLRRKALVELAKDLRCHKIATAHHADDNAETFLMRAMSGTGAVGLAGMRPLDSVWIKPLLWAARSELEAYARENRLAWVEDPSNERTHYLRNHIRHILFPQLETARVGSLKNLARAAERLEEEDTAWDHWLETQLDGPRETLSVAWLERWPQPLQRRVLRFWLKRLGLSPAPNLIDALLRGDELIHPAGSFLRRSDMLVFSSETEFGSIWQEARTLEINKRASLGSSLAWSFLAASPVRQHPVNLSVLASFTRPGQKWNAGTLLLSWDRTPWPLLVRAPRSDEMSQLQGVLKTFGIPKPYWKQWPVLVSQDNPKQIVGLLGLKVWDDFRAQAEERSVSITHFFEEGLKPL